MFFDIAIIGAGPCGLAAAARIREKTPSALFTNDEHARYWKKHGRHSNSLEQEHRRRHLSTDSGYASENDDFSSQPSITVLDASSDEWMSAWKSRFQNLKISHLRSPLFFHPDPRDRDGLLAFVHEQDRVGELREISNVVGKELSKHEIKRQRSRRRPRKIPVHLRVDGRDQIDYFTPSARVFEDYCDSIIDRYHLRHLVQKAKVLDINFDPQPQNLDHGLFSIETDSATLYSRILIIATGPSIPPEIPNLQQLPPITRQNGSLAHVFKPNGTCLPPLVETKLSKLPREPVDIIIVGGGLTSAQLADLLLRQHSTKTNFHIHLFLRHPKMKQKHFDIDLPWVTKTRNQLMSAYWSADSDMERLQMFRAARNGGSINPPFAKILQEHVNGGKLSIHLDTQLQLDEKCTWDDAKHTWTNLSITYTGANDGTSFTFPTTGIDHIIFCTGVPPSLPSVPFLQSLQRDYPIETLGGLPVLNHDLMYNDDMPLFFTGALAALRLGPGAANLAGARQGAERIAWGVEEILGVNSRIAEQKTNDLASQKSPDAAGELGSETGAEHSHATERKTTGSDDDSHASEASTSQRERSEFTGSFSNQFAALLRVDE